MWVERRRGVGRALPALGQFIKDIRAEEGAGWAKSRHTTKIWLGRLRGFEDKASKTPQVLRASFMDGPIAFFRSLAVERGVKAAVTNSLPLGRMRKKFIGPVRVKSQDYRIALDTNYCH